MAMVNPQEFCNGDRRDCGDRGNGTPEAAIARKRLEQLQMNQVRIHVLAVVIIAILTVGMRFHVLDVPLERDEGEYAYGAQLMLDGKEPYEHIYSVKLPGIFLVYAGIISLFGETVAGIHTGLMLVNMLSALLLFATARRLVGAAAGLTAAICHVVLSASQSVHGVFANSEHFVVPAAILGFFLLLVEKSRQNYALIFLAGLSFGTGLLIKQHGAAFILFGALVIIIEGPVLRVDGLPKLLRREAVYWIGALLPYSLICLWFAAIGTFERFWFWTVKYAGTYTTLVPPELAWGMFKTRAADIAAGAPLLWLFFLWGLAGLFWNPELRRIRVLLLSFLGISFIAVMPGFYFREHYFLLLLPAASLVIGSGIPSLQRLFGRYVRRNWATTALACSVAALCLLTAIYTQREFLFFMTPNQASRSTYGSNPFPESMELAKYLREHSCPEEPIAVIGSEPQIYFYSGRRAATGYIYMYPMMEPHEFAPHMQEEFIAEIEAASPRYMVYVQIFTSWLQRPNSHPRLREWFQRFQSNYRVVGLADIHPNETRYHWKPHLRWPPQSAAWLAVLERKD
jgi:hypothetical protein